MLRCMIGGYSHFSQPNFLYSFFFNDTATTEIYTLSLHDALPILRLVGRLVRHIGDQLRSQQEHPDRKSTRLNSSHRTISYAVFCLKKKKQPVPPPQHQQTPTNQPPHTLPHHPH